MEAANSSFEGMLSNLDVSVFGRIPSQTTCNDKKSLLACQEAVREVVRDYVYLEIGSYLGGSLQPHVLDSRCSKIYSIDKRPSQVKDERGIDFGYLKNSSQRMLNNLRQVSAEGTNKVVCIDEDASNITPDQITPRPHICFIDGEHTDVAVWNDFNACSKLVQENGVIVFHDAAVVYNGLWRIIQHLNDNQVCYRAYNLPDYVFVIEFNSMHLNRTGAIQRMLVQNHVGYLASLKFNDHYRVFVNKPVFRLLRNLRVRFKNAATAP